MASGSKISPSFMVFFLTFLISIQFSTVISAHFEVGGDLGWTVPAPKNSDFYNDWAANNRFQVNDTLSFEFEKDSVLVVDQDDYKKCKPEHPLFFSNNGNQTVYTLDRPDLFYFMSGVPGHCQKGLKMIVKVMEMRNPSPPQSADDRAPPSSSQSPSIYAAITVVVVFSLFMVVYM